MRSETWSACICACQPHEEYYRFGNGLLLFETGSKCRQPEVMLCEVKYHFQNPKGGAYLEITDWCADA